MLTCGTTGHWWTNPAGPNGPEGDGLSGAVDFGACRAEPWRLAPLPDHMTMQPKQRTALTRAMAVAAPLLVAGAVGLWWMGGLDPSAPMPSGDPTPTARPPAAPSPPSDQVRPATRDGDAAPTPSSPTDAAPPLPPPTLPPAVQHAPPDTPAVQDAPVIEGAPRTEDAPLTDDAPPTPLAIPVAGVTADQLIDTYGADRAAGRSHQGIDIAAAQGTPVVAVADGTVLKLFLSDEGGITLYQIGTDDRTIYYYAHLDRYADGVGEGDEVRAGDVLGYVGDSGNAGAGNYHLHFEVNTTEDPTVYWGGTPVNPYPLLTGVSDAR